MLTTGRIELPRVAAQTALTIATFLLVADALAALWIGGILGALGIALVSVFVILSLWHERLRAPLARVRGGDTVPAIVAAVASLVDVVYFAESVLDGLVHLLLFLLLYRLFTRRTLRDARDVGFICFFMLVAAAPGTFDVGFLFVFVGFLVLATWMLMLRHVLAEAERIATTTVTGASAVPASRLFVLSTAAAAATLLVTAGLFFVIPRIGQATLPLRMKISKMVSGFSEQVSLGAFGEIEADSAVVMRVYLPDGTPDPERLPGLRWRGIALDHFDGRAWTRDDPERLTVRRAFAPTFEIGRPRGQGTLLTQEIYLEPIGTSIVFAAPRVLRLGARSDWISIDGAGSVSVPVAAARLQYTVESEFEPLPPRARAHWRRVEPLDDDSRGRYLQLPALAPRISSLAREAAGDATDPYAAAMRLTSFLSGQYRYSRALERQTALPPLEEFLFVSRSGNCEYFAASLAVMLRTLGVPTRVVNGFQRGEWNPFGRYFMVRLLDAHSWVEAYVDDVGWVTLDPSPRGGPQAASAANPVNMYLDSLRLQWYRYVVNWSFHDQVTAASKVREAASTWRTPSLEWLRRPEDLRPVAIALTIIGGSIAVVVAVRRRGPRANRAGSRGDPPRFYVRALRALARRGFRPEAGETAREFAARVRAEAPGVARPLVRITSGYERVRFGEATLGVEELAELDECVAALGRRSESTVE